MNHNKVEEIVYIFKMRAGNDGSANSLNVRHLLQQKEDLICKLCNKGEETIEHIIEECEAYSAGRQLLI